MLLWKRRLKMCEALAAVDKMFKGGKMAQAVFGRA